MDYPHLFSPIMVRSLEIRNRIVMTAMHLSYTPEGDVTERLIEFYRARARGGVGLIIVGGCPIDEYGSMAGMVCIQQDRFIPGLKRLTSAVKESGARIAAQLYQAGRYTHSSMIGGKKPFSSSAVRSKLTGETPRALELEEIPLVQEAFAKAALRAKEAGFDAVEILGSAGYLISQFLSPLTNRREDQYGGSLENRMRFGIEVVEKVRRAVGPGYPVFIRLAGNDFMEGGNTNREARSFASEVEKAGVDLIDVTGGWHETRIPQLTMFVPSKAFVYLAQGIKSAVSVPVIASNRINDPALGEEIIRNGEADMVTMARALLADPELPNKAREGKAHLIYRCIACNQGCFDRIFQYKPVTCLVNPRAGLEKELEIAPAPNPRKVLVIGGGPAGLKAACTAAERGHRVTLVEKEPGLGGQVLLNRHIPGRKEMLRLVEDLTHNLEALGVTVMTRTLADRALVSSLEPEVVVLATGARPQVPDIPGASKSNVVLAWDVLSGKITTGRRAVVVGGNAVGLETALFLASQGTLPPEVTHFLLVNKAETLETIERLLHKGNKEVTVLEMTGRAGADIGSSTRWTVMAELRRLGVRVQTGARVTEITESGVTFQREKEGTEDSLGADTVVLATGAEPENGLAKEFEGLVREIRVIGDAKEPRNALEAVREGFLVGLEI
ncbi:MAG: FAD-dependent oxidoreductase [Deltaproteobacteria bacterium]|nr:FAD-dependent oxidoreductase [Deltaproteobacteria bacterium]MBW2137964.1 FAD-dependent oxidoreductase [Deltaproteobacteria bacterium]